MQSLTETIARCRAAITGAPTTDNTSKPKPLPEAPSWASQGQVEPGVRVRLPVAVPEAETVLRALETPLHPTAARIFRELFDVAVYRLQAEGQSLSAAQGIIHQPVEIICKALGISRVTFYAHLATLKARGVIYAKAHTGSFYGLSRKTGTLFAVALRPNIRARLTIEDLKHEWRDLEADTASGKRTAWAFLKTLQSVTHAERACRMALKAWAVNPGNVNNSVSDDCKGEVAEAVYSLGTLTTAHFSRRPAIVDQFARALATGFKDSGNLNFWRKLIWDALKREGEGLGTLQKLQNTLTRLMADVRESEGLKSPGALLVSRMKESGLWDELRFAGGVA